MNYYKNEIWKIVELILNNINFLTRLSKKMFAKKTGNNVKLLLVIYPESNFLSLFMWDFSGKIISEELKI